MFNGFSQDIRYAFRAMTKSPIFAIVAVLSMAMGIGATTAMFTVVRTVLLRPLPYVKQDRLVYVWETSPSRNLPSMPVRAANYLDWKQRTHLFEDVAISRDNPPYILTGSGDPVSILGYRFSANMFDVLGTKPVIGRTFAAEEDRPGATPVVVLSYKLWKQRFNADERILGQSITLSGTSYTVIGVMPPEFKHPSETTLLWTALQLAPSALDNRKSNILRVVGRLRDGVNVEDAQRELNAVAAQLEKEHPETNSGWRVALIPLTQAYTGDIKGPLLALFWAVTLLLVIASANVANLLMARAMDRRREFSIRVSLGATRSRIARQLLTESIVLSLIGGFIGLLLAFWSTQFLVQMFPTDIANLSIPYIRSLPIDKTVLAFSVGISFLTGIMFGIMPALQSSSTNITSGIHSSSRAFTASRRSNSIRSALIISEIAIALVLLTGAGLALKSFTRLANERFGFDPENVLSFYIWAPAYKYPDAKARRTYFETLEAHLMQIPGVSSVGGAAYLPLSGYGGGLEFTVEGQEIHGDQKLSSDLQVATKGYFESLRIPLLAGRTFNVSDTATSPEVGVVSKTFANKFFGSADPVGRRIDVGDTGKPEWIQLVGVVGDVREAGLDSEIRPELYVFSTQSPTPFMGFALRTEVSPYSVMPSVRQAVWSVDKDQPIERQLSMDDAAKQSLALRKITASLMTLFAGVSLLLACAGIYGVISYSVSQRTQEFGIRLALGATRQQLTVLVLGFAARLGIWGIAIGLALSFALSKFASAIVYGVSTRDLITFIVTPFLLATVALVAGLIPALRASRLDPVVALRKE